ncbi:MAG: threonine--tRNA ligase [Deltaproteobacteria bacterium]|jgi:threonyl-tRNA synthetase|nr:threonine--tRNA ligase [Deltaproteobacteria bacterium]
MSVYQVLNAGRLDDVEWTKEASPTALELFALAGLPRKGPGKPLAARVGGRLADLSATLEPGTPIEPVLQVDPEALDLLRHSVSHVMAEAVTRLFPGVKVAIGPSIQDGFYYDFDLPEPFTLDDLERISKAMESIVAEAQTFSRSELPAGEAAEMFRAKGEIYKAELIEDLVKAGETKVSLYRCGDFTDLCRGPHIADTSLGAAFKLLSVAGAYWRGDEKRPMLQRIYGTAFFSPKDLKAHLDMLEEAKRRDHRRLGRELDLFSVHEEIGGGLVVWHPKGALLRTILENFERQEHLRRGYQVVMGPQILRSELWRKSGHLDYYSENMYFTEIDGQGYAIKPMNCLAHMFIYRSRLRSFRDLPLRLFELGTVQRHEKSGVLHGLTRVRQFTQDDSHLFCTPGQVADEIKGVLRLISDLMGVFDFPFEMELSTRPAKSIGTDEDWEMATAALKEALGSLGAGYEINEGDGAFYGPKIDVKLKDALGRSWQCGTIQCDFTLPERFDLTYTDNDNQKKRPVMLHRTVFGSLERFIGILIEHYAGAFPVWLAPVQAILLTVTNRADEQALDFQARLSKAGLRVETDLRNEKLGYKIREARLAKIPFMLVFGDKEVQAGTASVRRRGGEELGPMDPLAFQELLLKEAATPSWD